MDTVISRFLAFVVGFAPQTRLAPRGTGASRACLRPSAAAPPLPGMKGRSGPPRVSGCRRGGRHPERLRPGGALQSSGKACGVLLTWGAVPGGDRSCRQMRAWIRQMLRSFYTRGVIPLGLCLCSPVLVERLLYARCAGFRGGQDHVGCGPALVERTALTSAGGARGLGRGVQLRCDRAPGGGGAGCQVGGADCCTEDKQGDSSIHGTGLLAVGAAEEPRVAGRKGVDETAKRPGPGWATAAS